jgi:hypothetical protein
VNYLENLGLIGRFSSTGEKRDRVRIGVSGRTRWDSSRPSQYKRWTVRRDSATTASQAIQ